MRVNGDEGTPVPIPNTVVKLINGDNTWLATAREDNTTRTLHSLIAQSVEHAAVNRGVVGSSPTWGAIKDNGCRCRSGGGTVLSNREIGKRKRAFSSVG